MAKDKKNKSGEIIDISKSKAKRENRKKELAKEKRNKLIGRIISIAVIVAIVGVIVFFAGKSIYLAVIRTSPNSDMSAGLTADGKIDGVDVLSALSLVDYENIAVPEDEIKATDDEVNDDIDSVLKEYEDLSSDTGLVIADGDKVNIDYVGTIDGVEFEGGNSGGTGYDLTIGSGSFVNDFEQQLIGHSPGENVSVEVTFPEDYQSDEVAGKDAVFDVTINGINVTPELTDEFVAENLSTDEISTAAEYRASVEKRFREQHLREYLTKYIIDNSTVNSYPNNYLKTVTATTKYQDESMLESYNQMFTQYGMQTYSSVWEMNGDEDIKDELGYELDLKERAKDTVKEHMVYQAIFERASLTIDMEAVKSEMTEQNGEEYVTNMFTNYGDGYMAQNEIKDAVIDYLMELYK